MTTLLMTDARIAAAKARCEAATPGDYGVTRVGDGVLGFAVTAGGSEDGRWRWLMADTCSQQDARYIAGALTDLPDALTDLDTLRQEVARLRAVAEAATAMGEYDDLTQSAEESCQECLPEKPAEYISARQALAAGLLGDASVTGEVGE